MTGSSAPGEYLELVAGRLATIRHRIIESGGDLERLTIVAVTKGHPFEAVRAASGLGLVDVGENYADELLTKAAEHERSANDPPARWHFLGDVQRNKLARLAPVVAVYQGVDRYEEAEAIARRSPGAAIFVEVDTSGESGRGGVPPEEVPELCRRYAPLPLELRGLMTVAPYGELVRARAAFEVVGRLTGELGLADCSMGMSDDFELAVRAGATVLRLGRALFGPRLPLEVVQQ